MDNRWSVKESKCLFSHFFADLSGFFLLSEIIISVFIEWVAFIASIYSQTNNSGNKLFVD